MSKPNHNYSQHYNKPINNNDVTAKIVEKTKVAEEALKPIPEVKMDITPDRPAVKFVQETVETKPILTSVEGVVAGCAKLNVRAEANLFADIVCVLDVMSEIEIDINKSTRDWFYVCTATGIEGYCMRKYIDAHL